MSDTGYKPRDWRKITVCLCLVCLGSSIFLGCGFPLSKIKERQAAKSTELKKERRRALQQALSKVVRGLLQGNGKAETKEVPSGKDIWKVEPLIITLKNENKYIRGEAAEVLGEIKEPKAVDPLITALQDNDEYVRGRAVRALGAIGDTRVTEPLLGMLKDENPDVRKYTVDALNKLGDTRAIAVLEEFIQNEANTVIREAAKKTVTNLRGK